MSGVSANNSSLQADQGDHSAQASSEPIYRADPDFLNEIVRSKEPPVYVDRSTGETVTKGKLVGGIPYTNPRPDKPSITIRNPATGEQSSSDNADHVFSQQSISKPLAMAEAVGKAGSPQAYTQLIATKPSGRPYNSRDLLPDGRPYNSSVNTGAIGTWNVIGAKTPLGHDPLNPYQQSLRAATGNPGIHPNTQMALGEYNERPSEYEDSNNQKIVKTQAEPGGLLDKAAPTGKVFSAADRQRLGDQAFLNYCLACSEGVNTKDLAAMGAMFENHGALVDPVAGSTKVLDPRVADFVSRNTVMTGSYDEAGEALIKHHAPVKSGVEGGMMGTVETADGRKFGVGAYHPDLNAAGNSGASQKYLQSISQKRIALPGEEGAYQEKGHSLTSTSPGEFGESPHEMDARLKNATMPQTASAIEQALQQRSAGNKAYYMKEPTPYSEAKNKNLMLGGEKLLTAPDSEGKLKDYVLAPSTHQLNKIRVLGAIGPAGEAMEMSGRKMPGSWPEDGSNDLHQEGLSDKPSSDEPTAAGKVGEKLPGGRL